MEHLPPWLRNVPLPPRPASAETASDAPDWLRDLEPSSAAPPSSAAAAPNWLPPAEPSSGPADEAVPEWLRDLQGEISAEADAAPPPPDDDTPDWLRDLTADPPAMPDPAAPRTDRPAPPGATSWLKSLADDAAPADADEPSAPSEPPTTTSRVRLPVGATDWLRSIGQETEPSSPAPQPEPAEPEPPADESGVPDWLRDVTPEELESAVAADVPADADEPPAASSDWLADLAAEARSADDDSISGAVPEWLADLTPADSRGAAQDAAPDWLTADDESADDAAAPDWLRDIGDSAAEPPSRIPSEPPATQDEDVPAWLRDAEETPEARPAAQDEDVPAWLRDAEETPEARPAAQDEDVPAWLRDAEETPEARPAAQGAEDVPAWLRDAEETPEARPAAQDEDVPAWLRDAEETPGSASGEVPTWLRDLSDQTMPAVTDEPGRPAEAEDAAAPTWLRDAMREEVERESLRRPPPEARADVPAWLRDEPDVSEPPPLPSEPAPDVNLPSWLRGVPDEPATPPVRPARAAGEAPPRTPASDDAEGGDFLRGADLPSWLRVSEIERTTESPEGQTVGWLARLGVPETETDEAEPVVSNGAAAVAPQTVYQRSSEQLEAIDLLSRLVHSPYPAPLAPPAPLPRTRWERIGIDRVLYAVLLLFLVLGLLVPTISRPFQTTTPLAPGAAELRDLIAGLDSEQVVLVAYEWAAQRSGELRPLEDAVTERLVAQQAKLIIVSTDLQGTLLSFDRIEPLREAGYNAAGGGTDYVLLGYRPGGELALRSLARNLRGELTRDFNGNDATGSLVATNLDGTPRVSSVSDLALIIVMADQPQDVQAWMEQVHRVDRDVPIAFILPQETQPLVQPYLRLPNVYHIAGRQGALALPSGGAADPVQIAQTTGQQNLAIVIFLLLLIGGAASVAIGRARRTRER